MTNILKWSEIKKDYKDKSALILGNGASIAFSNNFNYGNLKDKANLKEEQSKLFEDFKTDNFEKILKILHQANVVNGIFNIECTQINEHYVAIRNALIKAVKAIHTTPASLNSSFDWLSNFSKDFPMILNMNYDVLFYWMMMKWNDKNSFNHKFKDAFSRPKGMTVPLLFKNDFWRFKDRINGEESVSLVFYPHGNLILASDPNTEVTIKIDATDSVNLLEGPGNLLEEIDKKWKSDFTPSFVSEGTSEQKLKAIQANRYTSRIYYEVLPQLQNQGIQNIVIFGSSLNENDKHVWEQIGKNKQFKKIAVSVHGDQTPDLTKFKTYFSDTEEKNFCYFSADSVTKSSA